MNAISEINNWCCKNSKPVPIYTFQGQGTEWTCTVDFYNLTSMIHSCKSDAKLDVANKLWNRMKIDNKIVLKPSTPTIVLLDGDQRVDCWKWLAHTDVSFTNLTVQVFVGPVSHRENYDKMMLHVSKTTSRDSADAAILITLGELMFLYPATKILIVSADHILVQAAMDYYPNVAYATNLKELKEYFKV
jgi:hypothetical protein